MVDELPTGRLTHCLTDAAGLLNSLAVAPPRSGKGLQHFQQSNCVSPRAKPYTVLLKCLEIAELGFAVLTVIHRIK